MIERFDYDKHALLLSAWQRARNIPEDIGPRELYPRFGIVVDDCVVGFLYRTDAPGVGHLDGVIADPYASTELRTKAIDVLCTELVKEADKSGLVMLWAHTSAPSLIEVCERNGFRRWASGLLRVRKSCR